MTQEPPNVDARLSQVVQVGDYSTQINFFYNGTWTDSAAPSPLVSVSGKVSFPYRGLSAFGERDAALFFGREETTTAVVDLMSARLTGPGLVVVSGVSGAGKSSLLHAGVLPRLRGQGLASAPEAAAWPCVIFTPSGNPLGELALRVAGMIGVPPGRLARELAADPRRFAEAARQAALTVQGGPGVGAEPQSRRILIMVDQSEQLFAQCEESDRHAFLTALYCAATEGREPAALVVLVIRADFEACLAEYRPDEYPQLSRAVQDRYLVTSMTERQLRMAITEPAALAGSGVDGELTAVLLAETRAPAGSGTGGPSAAGTGALPLLSYALDQTWRHRAGPVLTLADYERTGGIQGAVAVSAQSAYDGLNPVQQDVARRVFVRLTATSDDGLDTSARVARADLMAGLDLRQAADVAAVLETFAAQRLLTLAAGTVEISHEALLTAWPLLHDTWLAQTREDRLTRTRLNATAGEWARVGRDPSYLYSGSRLEAASEAADRISAGGQHVALAQAEREFLDVSLRAARRRTRRGHGLVALLLALVAGLAVVAVAAIRANQSSSQERDIAISGQLAGDSEAIGEANATVAAREGLAAEAVSPTSAARYAMAVAAADPETATLNGVSGVSAVAFGDGGKVLATAENGGSVRLWNAVTVQQIGTLPRPPSLDLAFSVASSSDGKLLAVAYVSGVVRVWNLATRRIQAFFAAPRPTLVSTMAFSPADTILATGSQIDGMVRLWNLATGQQIASLDTGSRETYQLAFGQDGTTLAVAAGDGTAWLWNTATGRKVRIAPSAGASAPLPRGSGAVFQLSVAMSPDGRTLATGGGSGTQIWDVATGRLVRSFPSGVGAPVPVAFSPDGTTLATADSDGTIRLWNAATGRLGGVLATGSNSALMDSIQFSPDGRMLATTSDDSTARLWDLSTGQPVRSFGKNPDTQQVAFGPHGATLATGDYDQNTGAVRLWNVATGRQIRAFPLNEIQSVALSPDGRLLAAGGFDGAVLWNAATGRRIHFFPGAVYSVAFSPDGKTLAIADYLGDVHLWNVVANRQIWGFWFRATVESLVFSPASGVLAIAVDGTIWLRNVAAHRWISRFATGALNVGAMAFSSDGTMLSAGDNAGTALVWNLRSGHLIDRLFTNSSQVGSVAFSPNGMTLATADSGNEVRLWNIAAGKQLGNPITISVGIHPSVAFSPDGTTLATSSDGAAQLWDVSYLHDPLARLCAMSGGTFSRTEWAKYVPAGPAYRNVCAGTS